MMVDDFIKVSPWFRHCFSVSTKSGMEKGMEKGIEKKIEKKNRNILQYFCNNFATLLRQGLQWISMSGNGFLQHLGNIVTHFCKFFVTFLQHFPNGLPSFLNVVVYDWSLSSVL